jgi:hypothetical protein
MDELQGWTAIDTLYDLKGFQMAAAVYGPVYLILTAVVFGFGILRVLYKANETHRYRHLVVYVMSSIVLFWTLEPITVPVSVPAGYTYDASLQDLVASAQTGKGPAVQVANVPRLMALSHYGIGIVARYMTSAIDSSFQDNAFASDRAAVLLRMSRITGDDALRTDYQTFVVSCYLPMLAAREKAGKPAPFPHYDPFKVDPQEYSPWNLPDTPKINAVISSSGPVMNVTPSTVPGARCSDAAASLYPRLVSNVRALQGPTLAVVSSVLAKQGGFGGAPGSTASSAAADVVLRYVLHNETMGLLSTNEIAVLRKTLPDYEMFDRKSQTSGNSQDVVDYLRTAVSSLVKVKQSIDQWINHQAEGPATYYKATCYGPYAYGIAGMLVLALFPLVAFGSLLPGRALILLAWGKMLLSIKLWIVFWSILSRFNEFRYRLEDIGSGPENGIGDQTYIFPAIAAMYLLTPAISFAVVGLLSAAGGAAGNLLSSFLGTGGNSGIPGMFWGRGIEAALSSGNGSGSGGSGGGSGAFSGGGTTGSSAPSADLDAVVQGPTPGSAAAGASSPVSEAGAAVLL